MERHITLDRAMWGSDQAASVEVGGFMRLVSNIRDVECALGDGVQRVYPGCAARQTWPLIHDALAMSRATCSWPPGTRVARCV